MRKPNWKIFKLLYFTLYGILIAKSSSNKQNYKKVLISGQEYQVTPLVQPKPGQGRWTGRWPKAKVNITQ